MNSVKRQKDRTLKYELPRSVGAPSATGDQRRNNSRKNEEMEPKQKQHPVVDVTGDGSKVWCCKEQYCIGTWNVKSMNQGKLEEVKQEMARVNINILGNSKLRWTGMGETHSKPITQTRVHWVSDAIQPSHSLSLTSPPAPNPFQHQGLFKWVSSSHQVVKLLEFQLQHQSFQWTPRTDLL